MFSRLPARGRPGPHWLPGPGLACFFPTASGVGRDPGRRFYGYCRAESESECQFQVTELIVTVIMKGNLDSGDLSEQPGLLGLARRLGAGPGPGAGTGSSSESADSLAGRR
jgi:hypothetical protein